MIKVIVEITKPALEGHEQAKTETADFQCSELLETVLLNDLLPRIQRGTPQLAESSSSGAVVLLIQQLLSSHARQMMKL